MSKEIDEDELNKIINRIKLMYNNMLDIDYKFIKYVIINLSNKIVSKYIHFIALGCGTPTNNILSLMKSCRYQWILAIIIIKYFNINKNIYIYDPLMTKFDYKLWNLLLNELKYNNYFNFININNDNNHNHQLILFMPHCEMYLYKYIINGLIINKNPYQLAKIINIDGTINSNFNDNKFNSIYNLQNTIIIGNSLSNYNNLNLDVKFNEIKLTQFQSYYEAFNDTYISTLNHQSHE